MTPGKVLPHYHVLALVMKRSFTFKFASQARHKAKELRQQGDDPRITHGPCYCTDPLPLDWFRD